MNRSKLLATATLVAIQMMCSRALAQEQTTSVPDVVVTAERRETKLQDTPVAVTALTGAALEERTLRQAVDLSDSVPGLYVNKISASPSSLTIALRGAAEQTGGLVTSESPVALYVDDVYQARLSAANIELADVARIEVLRGPQGTLYGRNSMTGAVKYVTVQPSGDFRLKGEAEIASHNQYTFRASTGGAVIPDKVAFALSGFYTDRDGWQKNIETGETRGQREAHGVRLSVASIGETPIDWNFTVSTTKDDNDGISTVPVDPITSAPLAGGFSNTRSPAPAYGHLEQTQASLNLGGQLGPIQIRSITAYSKLDDSWALDFSGGFFNGTSVVAGFLRQSDASQDQFSQELQFLGDALDGKLEWLLGAFYFKETADQTLNDSFGSGVFGPFPVALLPTQFGIESESKAIYGQLKYAFNDQWSVTGGIRYTEDDKDFDGTIQNGFGFPPSSAPIINSASWNAVTPKLTIDYAPSEDVLLYASAGRGYRAGGFNGLAVANTTVFGAAYNPEYAWNYEAGAKMDLFDNSIRLNAAAYVNKLKNLQQNVVIGAGTTRTENAADATVTGVEVEATWRPTASIETFANVSLLKDEYDRLNPASLAAVSGAKRLPLVARQQVQLGFTWTGDPIGSLTPKLSADYNYRSGRFSEAGNSAVGFIPSVERVNVSAALMAENGWSARVWARNLLDEDAYYSGLSLIPGLIAVRFPEEPRTIGLTIAYKR